MVDDFVELDLQNAGAISHYLKSTYTANPEPTPSARSVTDVEANAIVRWFEHPEISYHRSGTRTLTRRIQRTQLGTYHKYREDIWLVAQIAHRECIQGDHPIPSTIQGNLDTLEKLDTPSEEQDPDWRSTRRTFFEEALYAAQSDRAVNKSKALTRLKIENDPHGFVARCEATFWLTLRRKGVRWLKEEPKHACPICEDGPRIEQVRHFVVIFAAIYNIRCMLLLMSK